MDKLNEQLAQIQTARDNMKVALSEKGQIVTNDIRTYAEAISAISGGGGDNSIKLFETEEQMQADTTSKEGDLAVVYNNKISNCMVDSEFQIATFPQTVILPYTLTDYIDVRFKAVDESTIFDCWGQLDSNNFMMDCYTETGSIRIAYESTDGITYTRTEFEGEGINGNKVDFGTVIKYEYSESWNDILGYFIQIGIMNFEGLYKYDSYAEPLIVELPKTADLSFDTNTNKIIYREKHFS